MIYDNNINIDDYIELLDIVGWKVLSKEQHQKAINNSMFISSCSIDGKCIGFARIVGDFSTHGLLCDVMVHPNYRNQGIASNLLNILKNNILDMLGEDEQFLLELCPASGKRDFYLKNGFKYKPENMDGMYLWIKKTKCNDSNKKMHNEIIEGNFEYSDVNKFLKMSK